MSETYDRHALQQIRSAILTVRNHRVILDDDLARFYGVTTKRLNEAVKRNADRFPSDFMFQLNQDEADDSRRLRSQIATSNSGRGGRRYKPYAFSEHGVLMAATVLNSKSAIEMSVFIVRAFVLMRKQLTATTTLAKRLSEIEKALLTHDQALIALYEQIRPLLLAPPAPPRKRIGFSVNEKRASYHTRRIRRTLWFRNVNPLLPPKS